MIELVDFRCVTCHSKFERLKSEQWKTQCYDCYKNFKRFAKPVSDSNYRIQKMGHKSGLYIAHPSVTADDVNKFIGLNNYEHGWGAVEWDPSNWSKFKIFVNSEDYD